MKRILVVIFSLIAVVVLTSSYLASCGGGGGGDGEGQQPPPGGSGTGADGVKIFWYSYDSNIAFGMGGSARETGDHGFIVAGSQSSNFSCTDVFVMKTDSAGTVQWKRRIAETGCSMAHDARQTSDGGYIITGRIKTAAGDTDVYLLKIDASGNTAAGWPKTYGGPWDDVGNAVLQVNDGYYGEGYIVVGVRNGGPSINEKVYIIRTDLAGTVIWEDYDPRFCGGFGEFGQDIAATPDGNYVIAGTSGCFGWKGFLLKIDGNGNELWKNAYNTPAATTESIYSVATVSDGFILAGSRSLLSGQPPVAGPFNALVIKTDANGNELWTRIYGGAGRDEAKGVTPTQDGNYLIIGYAQSYGGQTSTNPDGNYQLEDLFLIKVDPNGNILWQKAKGNRPTISDYGEHVCAVSDGGFAVTGSSNGNVLLAKFDKNGDTVNLGDTDLSITIPATTGTINSANALEVAASAVRGLVLPRDAGATTLDILIAIANGEFLCTSGTYSKTLSPDPVQEGSVLSMDFNNCLYGDESKLTFNGSFTLTVNSLSGLFSSGIYTVETTVNPINITTTEPESSITGTTTGGMHFIRQSAAGVHTEIAQSIATPLLTYSETGGNTEPMGVIGPFELSYIFASSGTGLYSFGAAGETLIVDPDSITGSLTITILQSVSGTAPGEPGSGSLKITAQDDSRITMTLSDGGKVTLAIDTNADGVDDGTINTSWDYLY